MRVLLIRLSALGDVVLVEPVARALRARFPGARVELLTDARYAELMRAGGFDAVHAWDRHGRDSGLRGLLRVVRGLGRFDLVADLQGKLRTRVATRLLPAARRVTLRKRGLLAGLLAVFGFDPPLVGRHQSAIYLDALDLADPGPPALAILAPRGPGLKVGLSPGTTHATKRWPTERFAELAGRLALLGEVELSLIGGPQDRPVLDAIRAAAPDCRFSALDVSALDVPALARHIAALDLFVGVDSGPAHIAAAAGVPTLVLFGPTTPERWGPRAPKSRALSLALDCSPCSNMGGERCPRPDRDHACLRRIEAATVDAVARELLGSR